MRLTLLCFVCLSAVLLHAQASPEEQAIADILFAKTSADVEKHLPEAMQNALNTIDKAGREQILSKPFAIMKSKRLKISEGSGLAVPLLL